MKIYYNQDSENNNQNQENEHVLQGHDIRVETKNQREKLKDKPLKDKVSYYVGYYKFHVLGIIVILGVLFSIGKTLLNAKDYCFTAMMVNSSNINPDAISTSFSEYASLDTQKYACYIDANETELLNKEAAADMTSSTRFAAMVSSKDLDIAMYDSSVFYLKAIDGVFMDLTTLLSSEDVEKYKDKFFYIDQVKVDELDNDDFADIRVDIPINDYERLVNELEMHMDPSTMEKPVAVGIVVGDTPFIKDTLSYEQLIPVVGVIVNSERKEAAVDFIHYIHDENIDFTQVANY